MTSKARFEGQQVINSLNFFVDSQRASIVGDKQSLGDNVHYGFEGNTIECKDGEVMRLSLVDFYMPNNQYNIDGKNSQATIICSIGGVAMAAGKVKDVITRGNYYDVHDVAINFASTLAASLQTIATVPAFGNIDITNHNLNTELTGPWHILTPPAGGYIGQPEKKLLDVTIGTQHDHTLTNLKVSCQSGNGETYLVLGGERGDDSNTLINSFNITIPDSKSIRIKGYYPMQLVTEPHVYLRCSLGQNGLESSILGTDDTTYNNDIVGSNILAKIQRNVENYSYAGNSPDEFFLTLQQRKLNSIGLFLTDSKSRPLGRSKGAGTGTAAGLETTAGANSEINYLSEKQSSLGNLYFTATIRIDIIKMSSPNKLETEPPSFPQFPSKANGVISFGSRTGFN